MDCCRTARRLGGEDVKVIVRSPFATMKAQPVGKRGRAARGHPDHRQPRAQSVRVELEFPSGARRGQVNTGAG